MKTTFR